jgi:hypothetical protein
MPFAYHHPKPVTFLLRTGSMASRPYTVEWLPSMHLNGINKGEGEGMSETGAVASRGKANDNTSYRPYVAIACIVLVQIAVLLLLERQWFCTCGSIRFWQGTLDPAQNSQQLTDPYSFLHFAFGCGLYLWLRAIRPEWHWAKRAAYAVLSSALWETVENLPFVIEIFGTNGSGMHYSGDSIANSLGDTLAVALGFAASSRLPRSLAFCVILAMEVATFALIGDSAIATVVRISVS